MTQPLRVAVSGQPNCGKSTMVTVVVIARESNWKWATFSVVGGLCFAFLVSVCIYQVGSALL